MKPILLISLKVFFIVPAILFLDFFLIALIGNLGKLLSLGENFYCGSYCIFAKTLLGLSAIFFLLLLVPEIIQIYKTLKNATSTEKQESL